MIQINDKWGIVIDENNYSPARIDKPREKGGRIYYNRIGYYETLQSAIGRVAEEMARDKLMSSDMSLSEAVEVIKGCYAELAMALAVTKPGSIEVKLG